MRTSTSHFYDSTARGFASNTAQLQRTVDQLSSGRRLLSASDDPVASSNVLLSERALAMNKQFQRNSTFANDQLAQSESLLGESGDALKAIRDVLMQAGNGALSDADRASLAKELRGQAEHLLGLANGRDGTGNYLFAGYADDSPPFSATRDAAGNLTAVSYVGSPDTLNYEVSNTRQIPVRVPGDQVFTAAGGGIDIFGSLITAAQALETPLATPADKTAFNTAMSAALGQVDGGISQVLNARTAMGAGMQELDSLLSSLELQSTQYDRKLGELRDLDYATAATDLSKQQIALQAAQSTFTRVSQLNLFQMLK